MFIRGYDNNVPGALHAVNGQLNFTAVASGTYTCQIHYLHFINAHNNNTHSGMEIVAYTLDIDTATWSAPVRLTNDAIAGIPPEFFHSNLILTIF